MPEQVILVDEQDNQIGVEEKMKAHVEAKLHRAFSVLVYNSKGEMLLQRRAAGKYHCPGLWANTCCSHPRPGETVLQAAHRRLPEEMGFDTELAEKFSFVYKAKFNNGLTEYEFDHVLIGYYDQDPVLNQEEADDFKWIKADELKKDIALNPNRYAYWFKAALQKMK